MLSDLCPTISRIEDLPPLEQVASKSVEWVVEGLFAAGAVHLITDDSGTAIAIERRSVAIEPLDFILGVAA